MLHSSSATVTCRGGMSLQQERAGLRQAAVSGTSVAGAGVGGELVDKLGKVFETGIRG